jgi:hypothetical protein
MNLRLLKLNFNVGIPRSNLKFFHSLKKHIQINAFLILILILCNPVCFLNQLKALVIWREDNNIRKLV